MLRADPAPNIQIGQNGSVPTGGAAGYVLIKSTTADYDIEWSSGGVSLAVPGLLFGCALSNNSSDPNNDIDFSIGRVTDDAHNSLMILTSILSKRLDAAWAVGTNQGGLDGGSKANSTWYHAYVIQRSDTGVVDALFSTSPTSPSLPTNYDRKRRVGSIRTDASGNIIGFFQLGDTFLWKTPSADFNITTLSTVGALSTVLIPSGIKVEGIFEVVLSGPSGTSVVVTVNSPDQDNFAPVGPSNYTLAIGSTAVICVNEIRVISNASSQIRTRANSSPGGVSLAGSTIGWVDTRERLYPQ